MTGAGKIGKDKTVLCEGNTENSILNRLQSDVDSAGGRLAVRPLHEEKYLRKFQSFLSEKFRIGKYLQR